MISSVITTIHHGDVLFMWVSCVSSVFEYVSLEKTSVVIGHVIASPDSITFFSASGQCLKNYELLHCLLSHRLNNHFGDFLGNFRKK